MLGLQRKASREQKDAIKDPENTPKQTPPREPATNEKKKNMTVDADPNHRTKKYSKPQKHQRNKPLSLQNCNPATHKT